MDSAPRAETSSLPLGADTGDEEDGRVLVAPASNRRARGIASRTDPLTGALQRAALAPAFAAIRRRTASVGLLLLDIDHFKSINDAFGHAAGDAVLHEFGERARKVLRGRDLLIRYGGDEFVVILPNTRLVVAHQVAERLLAYVSSRPFPGPPPLTVTLSIGCAVADSTSPDLSLSAVMERADAHLYRAKQRGRNQVLSAEEAPQTEATALAAVDAQGRLLERDGAFAQLVAWLDALAGAAGGLLRVIGAPGAGLTRFLGAVASTARLRGYRVLSLAGGPALRLRQYGALADALGGTEDGEVHDILHLLAWAQPAEATAVLVIVDRVSEVDAATLELLWQVVAHLGAQRVGLVVGLHPGLTEIGGLPDLPVRAETRLQPFSLAGLHVWLRGALHWEAPDTLSAWLHAQTDGYPALLEAAVRQLVAEGLLARLPGGAGWQVSPFVQEYPLRDWLLRHRVREEESIAAVRPYGLLVGRSAELAMLKRALREQRVVALAGDGGVGKTHLALQVAAELEPRFADGVIVAPLAGITAGEFVPSVLVRTLGLAVSGPQEPRAVVLEYLAAREVLVVLDGVEHLPEIGALVQDLVAAAPQVRLLVTTRDAAVVQADVVITLHGLRDDSQIDRLDPGVLTLRPSSLVPAATSLFLHSSSLPAADTLPVQENKAAIERICHLVQGYPLAIKMLASWTPFFSCEEIEERLAPHVPGRASDAPGSDPEIAGSPMQAVFDFFWTLLAEGDRQCIRGLALFRGGFVAEAAFNVAGVTPFLLAALRDRTFVRTDSAGRYYLHELLRQYAWAWFQDDGMAAEVAQRHAEWYAGLAEASATDMRGPHFRRWVERLEAEIDNLRTALIWATAHAPLMALQMTLDLTEFWLVGLHSTEGHKWIETAVARAAELPDALPLSMRIRALGRLGRLERQSGETVAARTHLTLAMALAEGESAGSDRALAYMLSTLANIETDLGAHGQAVALAQQALDQARRLGSIRDQAETSSMAAWPFIFAGNMEEASRVVEEGLRWSSACGDHRSLANLTNAQATIAYYDPGRQEEAIALYQRVIKMYEELSDWSGLLLAFNNLASVYVDGNQFDLAAQSFADARRIGRRVRQHRMMPNVLSGSGIVASVRGDDAAAWGFWREALHLALASHNTLILEECVIGVAYTWARGGFAAHAAVLIGVIGLQPAGKPWLLPSIERAGAIARPALSPERWEALLAHGSGLDLTDVARLLLALSEPHDVPESLLPIID